MYRDKCDSPSIRYPEAGFYNSYKNIPVTYLFGTGRLLQSCGLQHLNRNGLKERFPGINYDNSPINLDNFTRGRLQNSIVYYLVLSPGGSKRLAFLRTVQTGSEAHETPAQWVPRLLLAVKRARRGDGCS